jgi:hypothetical protein
MESITTELQNMINLRAEEMRKEYNRNKIYTWRQKNIEKFREYQRIKANEKYAMKKLKKMEECMVVEV